MIILYDDLRARAFEPFATTRPLGEVRAGALLVRERWAQTLARSVRAFVGAAHHDTFSEFDAPPSASAAAASTGIASAASIAAVPDTILVNTRALPFVSAAAPFATAIDGSEDASIAVWTVGGRVAAVRLSDSLDTDHWRALEAGTLSLDELAGSSDDVTAATRALDGVWLEDVWDIITHLNALLASDIPALASRHECVALDDDGQSPRGPVIVGAHPVWLEREAHVEPFAVFDTTLGPVLLRRGATVQAFTRVVGPCYIGCDSTVMADRISGSAIGDTCRVHGEVSATVFIGHANKGHEGFVGHSIIGRWVNLGASTVTSNLKNTYGTVALWTPEGIRDTGLQFLGTLFGDHAKTGIGLRLTTGCVLSAGANVMDTMPPKYVPPFSWGSRAPYERFELPKFLETAERMMGRRKVTLTAAQREHLATLFTRAFA